MKKILITGANSYIGTSFESYIKNFNEYTVDTVDMIDGSWRNMSFTGYDVVFHVAGIAHSDTGKANDEIKANYYKVNTDLTVETAQKAKSDGVNQFIFMSSIIVFGSKNECITNTTVPKPDNFYGDSKLQADIKIHELQSDTFNVVSIRPPMIYGKNSKGNYPKLAKLAKKIPFFPHCDNKRSMLYIDNLCEFVRLIIDDNASGYFFPQNKEYVNTSHMVKKISDVYEKKLILVKGFEMILKILSKKISVFNKLFGNMYYDFSLSDYKNFKYCITDFENSIVKTEE